MVRCLAYAEDYPVGSWMNRYTRPDLFILQHSSIGKEPMKGEAWIGTYDRYLLVECKVALEDTPNAAFQLLMALVSVGSLEDLDFHHGGLGPILAIPTKLRDVIEKRGLLKELEDILSELDFGLIAVDKRRKSVEWVLRPGSFAG